MEILSGLFDQIVLQRTARNRSAAAVTGTAATDGPVQATVRRGRGALAGWKNKVVGKVTGGHLAATLKGLPVGGPYEVTLSAGSESLTVKEVLVGDVWLLGGQSNMQGVGQLEDALAPDPMVRAFYMNDQWGVAEDPLHHLGSAVDEVHWKYCGLKERQAWPTVKPVTGVGPGVPFGMAMLERTGVPQGLIAAAHGGTSMTQWDPKRRDEGGTSLYGAMIRRLRKNGGQVAGMIWYQGESDASQAAAALYTTRMIELVDCLRRDANAPALPVVIVQISRVVGWGDGAGQFWNAIQEAQRRLPSEIPQFACVPAIDLSLDDPIHISGRGNIILGWRLASAMEVLRRGAKAGLPEIAFKETKLAMHRSSSYMIIEVHYDHVQGQLRAGGRPMGFSLSYGSAAMDRIVDVRLEGSVAKIALAANPREMEGWTLHYGRGSNPCCNIVDEGGRSLPVMGPIYLGEPRALTPFAREWRTTPVLPGQGQLKGLKLPKLDKLGLVARSFPGDLTDRHLETDSIKPNDGLLYYACHYTVPAAMGLKGLLGYDGPVKVWVDGQEVYHDPAGTNPAWADQAVIALPGTPGTHEVVVALGLNGGRAWGIMLRLQRTDVPRAQIEQGPAHYTLPTLGA